MSTPQVPSGQHVPAPDASPSDGGPQAVDGRVSAVDRARRMVPEGTFAVGAGLAIAGRHHLRLPDPRVPRAEQARLRGAQRAVGVRVRARAGRVPAARAGGRAGGRGPDRARRRRRPGRAPRRPARRRVLDPARVGDHRALGLRRRSCRTSSTVTSGWWCASIVALFTFGIEYLARGAFAGVGRFGAYGLSLGAEGVIRLLPCIPLAIANVTNPLWYGLCLAVPPLIATAHRDVRADRVRRCPGPPRRGRSCRPTSGSCSAGRCWRRC